MSAARSQLDAHGALLAMVRLRQTARPPRVSGVRLGVESFAPTALDDDDDRISIEPDSDGRYVFVRPRD